MPNLCTTAKMSNFAINFFKLVKTGEFLSNNFNIEDRRKKQHFQYIMLYYFRKGKNATEMQKK